MATLLEYAHSFFYSYFISSIQPPLLVFFIHLAHPIEGEHNVAFITSIST